MPREEKKYMLKEITGRLKKSQNIFIAGFKNLKATDMDSLREKLEQATSSYLIIKNTLAKNALKDAKLQDLSQFIEGPISFTLVDNDNPVQPAKILVAFAKEHKGFSIRGGYVAGEMLLEEEVKKLASLPSREVLLAQVVGGICAPLSGLVYTLSGLLRGFVRVLDQIRQKMPPEEEKQRPQAEQNQQTQEQPESTAAAQENVPAQDTPAPDKESTNSKDKKEETDTKQ